jgi:hypothetical protein
MTSELIFRKDDKRSTHGYPKEPSAVQRWTIEFIRQARDSLGMCEGSQAVPDQHARPGTPNRRYG